MALIQVRNVPDELHRRLKERAAREGLTLSALALDELARAADRPTRREILERLRTIPPVPDAEESAAASVRAERDAR